jgi:DNA-binding NtrC family response regulator
MSVYEALERAAVHLDSGSPEAALELLHPWRDHAEPLTRARVLDALGRAHLAAGVRSLVLAHGDAGRRHAAGHTRWLTGEAEEPHRETDGSGDRLEAMRVQLVLETLAACDWVQSVAADQLGISKFQMHRLLRKHDLLDAVRERRVKVG